MNSTDRELGELTARVGGVEHEVRGIHKALAVHKQEILGVLKDNRAAAAAEHEALKTHVTRQFGEFNERVRSLELADANEAGALRARNEAAEAAHKGKGHRVAVASLWVLLIASIIGSLTLAYSEHALKAAGH